MAENQAKPDKIKPNHDELQSIKPNQVKTVSDVTIPLELVYKALEKFIDGTAQTASVKDKTFLVVNVEKVVNA